MEEDVAAADYYDYDDEHLELERAARERLEREKEQLEQLVGSLESSLKQHSLERQIAQNEIRTTHQRLQQKNAELETARQEMQTAQERLNFQQDQLIKTQQDLQNVQQTLQQQQRDQEKERSELQQREGTQNQVYQMRLRELEQQQRQQEKQVKCELAQALECLEQQKQQHDQAQLELENLRRELKMRQSQAEQNAKASIESAVQQKELFELQQQQVRAAEDYLHAQFETASQTGKLVPQSQDHVVEQGINQPLLSETAVSVVAPVIDFGLPVNGKQLEHLAFLQEKRHPQRGQIRRMRHHEKQQKSRLDHVMKKRQNQPRGQQVITAQHLQGVGSADQWQNSMTDQPATVNNDDQILDTFDNIEEEMLDLMAHNMDDNTEQGENDSIRELAGIDTVQQVEDVITDMEQTAAEGLAMLENSLN